MSNLSPFDGRDVLRVSLSITGAGDGLSQALNIEPVEYKLGDQLDILLRGEVVSVEFDPIKDTEALTRKHVLKAGTVTIVDREFSDRFIADQAAKNERARQAAAREKDEAAGKVPLDPALDTRPTREEIERDIAGDGFFDPALDTQPEPEVTATSDAATRAGVPSEQPSLRSITGGRAAKQPAKKSPAATTKKPAPKKGGTK